MSPRWAVTAIFLLNGVALASWAARLPALEARLDLGAGGLSIVLAAVAAGALLGMPLAGRVISRVGSRAPTRVALVAFAAMVAVVTAAPSLAVLLAAAFALGAFNGALDVSMNAQGVTVERRAGRPILASMHAAWSIGGLLGAGLAAAAAAASLDVRVHLLAVGVVTAVAGTLLGLRLLPGTADASAADAGGRGPIRGRARRRLALLGAVAFCGLLGEGAAHDWSAVYINDSLGASEAVGALGFTAYMVAMTVARLVSDRLTTAVGPVAAVRGGALLAGAGLGIALLVGHPAAALAGFACLGLGLAPTIPIIFRAAGHVPGVHPARALARTSATGYLGLLAGPPLIGGLAELTTLPLALGFVVLAVGACAALAGAVDVAERADAEPVPAPA
jgi:MFS family permease